MKKFSLTTPGFTLSLSILLLFSGCIKDEHNCSEVYKIYTPVFKTLTEVRAGMKSSAPQAIKQTGKLYVYGDFIFLNEPNQGIHVIDNTKPSAPKNISFIPIPGNIDLAVRGNYLYVDSYTDLVVLDISNPTSITPKKFMSKVFEENWGYYWGTTNDPDSVKVLCNYEVKDTVMNCETYRAWSGVYYDRLGVLTAASSPTYSSSTGGGKSGSMARFTIVSDYLYTVTYSQLYSFDLSQASEPQLRKKTSLNNWSIETIFPFKNRLFIGSSSGMYIYDLTDPASPSALGQMNHVRSCDPVIADDHFAYVTLRSGTACQGFTNQLEILNIDNLMQPQLVKTYGMTNPHGLSKDGDLLFVCDGKDGLKIFNASDVNKLLAIKTFPGFQTYDVIADNGLAYVVADDGLRQYDYTNASNIRLISKVGLSK